MKIVYVIQYVASSPRLLLSSRNVTSACDFYFSLNFN